MLQKPGYISGLMSLYILGSDNTPTDQHVSGFSMSRVNLHDTWDNPALSRLCFNPIYNSLRVSFEELDIDYQANIGSDGSAAVSGFLCV
jgi:hypothetical protein